MTAEEVAKGLPLPYAAQALMGKGGAGFILLIAFLACTSGFSADIVAVASVWTYDIYGTYINPNATGARLVRISHIGVVIWSVCMAIIATGLSQTSIGVNYLVTCMGVFTCSFVFPMYSTLLWKGQNRVAIVAGPVLGSLTAIACWLGSAYALEGSVTVTTTSAILPLVIGNGTSLLSGAVFAILLTFIFGKDDFDWERFKTEIKVVDDSDVAGVTSEQIKQQLEMEHLAPGVEKKLIRAKKVGIIMAVVSTLPFCVESQCGTSY